MNKLTLSIIILFIIVTGTIYILNLFYSPRSPILLTNTTIKPPILSAAKPDSTTISTDGTPLLNKNEIARHNTTKDCYLMINNNVYDVSLYINMHPGGKKIITTNCGREVTGIFARIHSNRAWDLLKNYKIGQLANDNINTTPLSLNAIEVGLQKANPDAEIVNVKPKNNLYLAKIIYQNKLYEIHLDLTGNIISEEVESAEYDWSLWDTDQDDQ
ncbi:MAG: cytochrome b5-like heme/steroid binding domain-containing protein [Candidatus Komeilibacteria bacterium]